MRQDSSPPPILQVHTAPPAERVTLQLVGQRWSPRELILAVTAILCITLVPFVQREREEAARLAQEPVRPVAGGIVEPGYTQNGAPPGEVILKVHVVGAVRYPGVYELFPGNRVEDALDLAGGALRDADLARLNLAAQVQDADQIVVRVKGEGDSMLIPRDALPEGEDLPLSRDQQIRLNFCEANDLERVPGIGPTLAKAIVDYREARGPYTSLNELNEVPGIGAKKLATLARYVRLD